MKDRDNFGGRYGVLVALAGSAIGLGNLWRFPYLVGKNGGAAFIFIYLFMVVVLCMPVMLSEFVIGRRSGCNAFGAFKALSQEKKWRGIGLLGVFSAFVTLSFYIVVGGWSVDYLYRALHLSLTNRSTANLETLFGTIITKPWEPLIYLLVFLGFTGMVVLAGVKKGIERSSKFMMPMMFVLIVIIALRSLMLPGSMAGVRFLFRPDFSAVTPDTFLAALGQAFFSLSIGLCTILTYASYVKKDENIVKTSFLTVFSDTGFALLAGLAIMPAVFSFGISPGEGPGLVFVTLPLIFSKMAGGAIIAILFFFTLFIAALTSSISLMEVCVAYLIEERKVSRRRSVALCFGAVLLIGALCSLSQGRLSHITFWGKNLFDSMDFLSGNVLLPFGGLLLVIFAGWKMKKADVIDELTNGGRLKINPHFLNIEYFILKYLAPLTVATILITGWLH